MMSTDVDYCHPDGNTSLSNFTGGENRTNLIINYLPQSLTDQEFYKIFIAVGPIKNCRIMKDLHTYYSFGFGFVEYQRPEDAAKAILTLNNLPVQHKRIKVSYARPPGDDIKETNLYIQNIPRSYSLDQLEDLFSPYGAIVQKNLLKDKVTGLPRGVGFVRYDKKSEADNAMEQLNGVLPEGGNEPLIVKIAEEHGKMKAAYIAGYQAGIQNHRGRGRGSFNGRGGGRGAYNSGDREESPFPSNRSRSRFDPIGHRPNVSDRLSPHTHRQRGGTSPHYNGNNGRRLNGGNGVINGGAHNHYPPSNGGSPGNGGNFFNGGGRGEFNGFGSVSGGYQPSAYPSIGGYTRY